MLETKTSGQIYYIEFCQENKFVLLLILRMHVFLWYKISSNVNCKHWVILHSSRPWLPSALSINVLHLGKSVARERGCKCRSDGSRILLPLAVEIPNHYGNAAKKNSMESFVCALSAARRNRHKSRNVSGLCSGKSEPASAHPMRVAARH